MVIKLSYYNMLLNCSIVLAENYSLQFITISLLQYYKLLLLLQIIHESYSYWTMGLQLSLVYSLIL